MLSIAIFGATLLLLVFLIYRGRGRRGGSEAANLPPGSKGLPFIGETLQMLIPSHTLDLPSFFKSRFLRYGPVFQTRLIGRPVVVSADLNLNRLIVQNEGTLAEMWYFDTFSKIFSMEGEGRLYTLGTIHKYFRGITLKHFGTQSLKDKLLSQMHDVVSKTLRIWSSQGSIEVKRSVLMMNSNFAANLVFGHDEENTNKKLGEKFAFLSQCFLSLPINIPGTSHHKCLKYKEEITSMIKAALKERLNSPESRRGDFIDHAIEDLNTQEFLTDEFFSNIAFCELFAISDTISTSMTMLLKLLSENPLVIDELTVEHERIAKNRTNPDQSQLTWDEVINESLRLGSQSLGLLRKALKDIQFNGYTIPAGWIILMVTSASNVDPNIFTDPLTFNPSRWKDLAPDVVSKNFMPFGGGIRQCGGAEFTKVFMATLLHVLVTKYRWTKIKGGEISRTPALTFKNGLHIKVVERNSVALCVNNMSQGFPNAGFGFIAL